MLTAVLADARAREAKAIERNAQPRAPIYLPSYPHRPPCARLFTFRCATERLVPLWPLAHQATLTGPLPRRWASLISPACTWLSLQCAGRPVWQPDRR